MSLQSEHSNFGFKKESSKPKDNKIFCFSIFKLSIFKFKSFNKLESLDKRICLEIEIAVLLNASSNC